MQNSVPGYAGLKAIASKPDGGFHLIRVRSLLAAWVTFKIGYITFYDLRMWLACHEMLARRCQLTSSRLPTFTEQELITLVGSGTTSKAKKGIQRLTTAGLLNWERNCISTDTLKAEAILAEEDEWLDALDRVKNNRRKVPFPRRMLRHVIMTRHVTLIGTVIGYLFRCLYYKKGRCISGGRCKASWISEALQLDIRNVKAARQQLIQLGWIAPCDANQTSLNRWGLPVVISLQWKAAERSEKVKTPLPIGQNQSKVPPPIINNKPLTGSNNQKLPRSTGVKNKTRVHSEPSLKHIALEDLRDPVRLDQLYQTATKAGMLPHSEFNRLQWFAAAEHAVVAGKRNPCGLFVSIYRQKLWHHITHEQEDSARAKLKMLDFGETSRLPGDMREFAPDYKYMAA